MKRGLLCCVLWLVALAGLSGCVTVNQLWRGATVASKRCSRRGGCRPRLMSYDPGLARMSTARR